ncbi:MAG TPA: response regulator transcription factor [Chitinophagaceae bacterium]|jgi:two-component system invasion response regulator UvrY|nr:response regulator transcription factor [Chitinophagaceae bacterium]
MDKITILITDDHKLIREAWTTVLESDPRFKVIARTGSGEEAVELAKELRPHIIILDINLPGMNGFETIPLLRKFSPGSKILGVSLHTQPAYARKMIQKGAMGYVTKNSSREEMFTAIIETYNGRKYICDEIKNILSEQMLNGDENKTGLNSLSQREIEIISFIKKGDSSKEIAEALSLSAKTIEVHRYNLMKKLGLKNTAALVNFINNSELGIAD